jgi:hypothetical protein
MDVRIGTEVEVEPSNGSTRIFKIVEPSEIDPKSGLISDQSPVGKALVGHKEGDEVTVSTPGGITSYLILSIKPLPGDKYTLLAQSQAKATTGVDLFPFSGVSYSYENHCWNCKQPISSAINIKCPSCGGYKCRYCGSCFC